MLIKESLRKMINKKKIRKQCEVSYGKNVRLKHLERCLKNRKFKKAVEIGCGPAWLLHNVNAYQKIGYDIDPIAVFEDVKYIKREVEDIKENFVDLLICSEVIEHLENDQTVLNSFWDFVSEGGLVFLTTINKNVKTDKSEQDKKWGHLRRYSANLKEMMEQARFKTLDFYSAKSQYYYINKGNIKNYSCEKDIEESLESDASMWIYFGVKKEKK